MGYRSKAEASFASDLAKRGVRFEYETLKLDYTISAKYIPDFKIGNMIIEYKGRLTAADRRKMICVKRDNPTLDIRFVFQNPNLPIRKGSRTTYGMWATANGFKWASKVIPNDWIK